MPGHQRLSEVCATSHQSTACGKRTDSNLDRTAWTAAGRTALGISRVIGVAELGLRVATPISIERTSCMPAEQPTDAREPVDALPLLTRCSGTTTW